MVHLVLLRMILVMMMMMMMKNIVVKLVYKSDKQFDASKEFNVNTKQDVIEKENVDVSHCKDDILKKKDYDGNDGNSMHQDCNVGDDKVDVGMCGSGVVGTSDDNAGIGTSDGTRDVGNELVADYANVSGTVNLNSSADIPVYSKRICVVAVSVEEMKIGDKDECFRR
ncbi:conserved hypothetical protein [Ricinus communis]|uniref:Uncharacterized protein n=1 Tax=Ricinus communis TaxID=3988 RepID=B9SWT9_RICCO|nr:conserved hypothetical protein [Ricinus communis]